MDPHIKSANLEWIKRVIAHRYPFLLIDRVENMIFRESVCGIKNVTINEPYFQGHFPDMPVMPGVLILEAMAQTAAVAACTWIGSVDTGALVYFMGIDKCKFRQKVVPGDVLRLELEVARPGGRVWRFAAKGCVDGVTVAEAHLTAMIDN